MTHPKTMKVKPWGNGQGDHVEINVDDFDPEIHERLDNSEPVAIPDGWDMLHWTKRVKMARMISGSDEEITSEQANEIITAELKRREADAG
jgi:hypothetical protein